MKYVVAIPKSVLLVVTILTLALFASIYPIIQWKPVFASPDTITLRPNSVGSYQAWGTFGSPPSHWQGTSDQSDTTGVQVTTSTSAKETENLADTSQTGTINSVTAYIRARALNYSAAPERAVIIWKGVSEIKSSAIAIGRDTFADYSDSRTTATDGSSWTWTKINNLEIGSSASTLGTNEVIEVSEYWIVVDHVPAGYKLNLKIMDYDLVDVIANAYVCMNNGTDYWKTSDSNEWTNYTGLSGTVTVKVQYFGFWVNGTFSVTMDSDKTINIQCKLYDVTVLVQESVQNAYLASIRVFSS